MAGMLGWQIELQELERFCTDCPLKIYTCTHSFQEQGKMSDVNVLGIHALTQVLPST